jgi:Tol biopolymer transport system component
MGKQIGRLSWSADGRDLIFSAGNLESAMLWRLPVSGGSPKRLTFAGEATSRPKVSPRGDRMVFERYSAEYNIWSLQLDENGQAADGAVKAFDSSKSEICPTFSPDGTKVAFESGRSGNDEIWVCRSDNSECTQLTWFGDTHAGSPAWSPDGNWIAFDVFRQSRFEIYVVNSSGGKPRLLSGGVGLVPRWSGDGKWIYFRCNDNLVSNSAGGPGSRRFNVCRVPAAGGNAERLTRTGGQTAAESPDGKWIYYSDSADMYTSTAPLRRIPVSGGKPSEILPQIAGRNFIVLEAGIWYLAPNTREGSLLQYYDFATRSTRTVYRTTRPVSAGLTISPDRKRILFTQIDRAPSYDVMLVEHFR